MKKIIIIMFALCVSLTAAVAQQMKLKVLFVGYDPSSEMPVLEEGRMGPGGMSDEAFKQEYPVRMPAFKALLSRYFSDVKTMDVRDWKATDSDSYDVTIFDFPTTPTKEMVNEVGPDGRRVYKPAEYLPNDFSKPVVFIASTADQMGRSIGLKLDWLCLCLDADAHHVKTDHPIFHGPLEKVKPTFANKPTPEGVFHYESGKDLPAEIPMWRVDKDGYLSAKPVRIGLVARGSRFSESPDTEMISSGVSQKDIGAVALGRHGNFFLWGFGASPDGMTEEGKKAFVNSVAYMAQFDGRTPIARKYNDRMATTDDVKEVVAGVSRESYEDYVTMMTEFNAQSVAKKKSIDAKQAAGEELNAQEKMELQYVGNTQEIESWEEFVARRMGRWADRFGTDDAAFRTFMEANMGYIYCDPTAFFTYDIDEDVQKIGISNHDVGLLERCIEMMQKNEQPELALRVLKRYTDQDFNDAASWKKWLDSNKSKLFFTETDGYRFMVDTYSM